MLDGCDSAVPYLCCAGAADAIEFYKTAFGAVEIMRIGGGGQVGHAEIRIGNAIVMLADEFPSMNFRAPGAFGGSPVLIHVYVDDVDALVARATKAGAMVVRPPQDQFNGDRSCELMDPFGHTWGFASRIENLTPKEINARAVSMGLQDCPEGAKQG